MRRGLPHPESRGPGPPAAGRSRPPIAQPFKEYDLGFVHMDVKHLPKLRTQDGQSRKRYLYVASDRASRFVHLAVKDDETVGGGLLERGRPGLSLPGHACAN